jgi:putative photosynthetic complex assembly protein
MSAIDREPFPRGALIAAGTLVLISLASVGTLRLVRLSDPDPPLTPAARMTAAPTLTRTLAFEGANDGVMIVRDVRTGAVVATLEPDQDGFVRGVLRSMARARHVHGLAPGDTFTVARDRSGALSLTDPDIGEAVLLDGFGGSNAAAFARFLPASANAGADPAPSTGAP